MVLREADNFAYPVNEIDAADFSKPIGRILKLIEPPFSFCRIIECSEGGVPHRPRANDLGERLCPAVVID